MALRSVQKLSLRNISIINSSSHRSEIIFLFFFFLFIFWILKIPVIFASFSTFFLSFTLSLFFLNIIIGILKSYFLFVLFFIKLIIIFTHILFLWWFISFLFFLLTLFLRFHKILSIFIRVGIISVFSVFLLIWFSKLVSI